MWAAATQELACADAKLKPLIDQTPGLPFQSRGDPFATLCRAIVGQQISMKAARSVWSRLEILIADIHPQKLLDADEQALRQCGLSGRKVLYLRDLAEHFRRGALGEHLWVAEDDEALIAALCRVRGIGRWTAEMFMIFYLMRPDVLPLDDLGLQRGMEKIYNDGKPLARAQLQAIGERWAPWRSVGTWYMWRAVEPIPVVY